MNEVWVYSTISVFIVMLISLVGIVTLSIGEKKLQKILILLVSFSAGALLGDAFIHLLPEAFKNGGGEVSLYVLSGLLFFFVLEKIIHWRHCHQVGCEEHSSVLPSVILIGDSLHNFIDGMIIGASYIISIPLGIATTVAVIFHEIPQEIGDFGTLLYGGFSKKKALIFNFIGATSAFVGLIFVLAINSNIQGFINFLIPFAAGGFVYISASDMIPELHKHNSHKISEFFKQLVFFILGIVLMYMLLFLE